MRKKNSFVLYSEYIAFTDELSDEQAGKLFKAILAYENGIDADMELDVATKMAFNWIKRKLDEDEINY